MKDMTQGKPLKLIIGFAVPMLIGNIFQQVYNVADTVIVGRFLGESTLAGGRKYRNPDLFSAGARQWHV